MFVDQQKKRVIARYEATSYQDVTSFVPHEMDKVATNQNNEACEVASFVAMTHLGWTQNKKTPQPHKNTNKKPGHCEARSNLTPGRNVFRTNQTDSSKQ